MRKRNTAPSPRTGDSMPVGPWRGLSPPPPSPSPRGADRQGGRTGQQPQAAGPVARVLRDATLPVILKLTANSKQVTQRYRYHIDWRMPISSVTRACGGVLPAGQERGRAGQYQVRS